MAQSIILFGHIASGTVAVLAGYTALFMKKGGVGHIKAGRWFVIAMVLMAITGSVVAFIKPMMISVIAGMYTLYLVLTAVAVFRASQSRQASGHYVLMYAALAIGLYSFYCVYVVSQSETGRFQGFSAGPYIMFGVLAIISAMLDLRYIMAKQISQRTRVSRHVWRMCFAMFIAVGSFVGQGLQHAPEDIRHFLLVEYADLIILLLMMYWLIRVNGLLPRVKQKLLKRTQS
ncbi:hypothetical protein [Pseudoalteromonas sp. MMG022]|uniref:hypothetical protein n=1 Tax=Pseudoalteromonas sp. MMG022 TaxID=2909978 RepID=UPI001F2DE7D8|nr:hypothetical protein [Pseudoalteromonas sp. MMG022]MCF6436851.1 hypothetical protein [Pseudoalteromonas sp. MMG022]